MSIRFINTGSSPNKGDGDTLRTAFNIVNQNFSYLSTLTASTNIFTTTTNIFTTTNIYNITTGTTTGDITFENVKIIGAGTASGVEGRAEAYG